MTQSDERGLISAAMTGADEALALAKSADSTLKSGALVWEYTLTISEALPISLNLTTKRTVAPAANAKIGDLVFVHPSARPTMTGVTLGAISLQSAGFVNANGFVDVNYILPILSIAGTLNMPVRLRGFRPA